MNTLIMSAIICAAASVTSVGGYVEGIDGVRSAVFASDGDTAVVAIISEPIFLKSERDALMKRVAESVGSEFGYARVIVSMDSDIYYLIMSGGGEIPDGLIATAIGRGGSVDYRP